MIVHEDTLVVCVVPALCDGRTHELLASGPLLARLLARMMIGHDHILDKGDVHSNLSGCARG